MEVVVGVNGCGITVCNTSVGAVGVILWVLDKIYRNCIRHVGGRGWEWDDVEGSGGFASMKEKKVQITENLCKIKQYHSLLRSIFLFLFTKRTEEILTRLESLTTCPFYH